MGVYGGDVHHWNDLHHSCKYIESYHTFNIAIEIFTILHYFNYQNSVTPVYFTYSRARAVFFLGFFFKYFLFTCVGLFSFKSGSQDSDPDMYVIHINCIHTCARAVTFC